MVPSRTCRLFCPPRRGAARQRLDFCNWYLDSMSDWADRWGQWAKAALPEHPIYQSVGGWDAVHNGTDSVRVTRDAARRGVGIRVTNEGDNFAQNFGMTRLLSSATRFYGNRFALEPAGFSHCPRGGGAVVWRAGQRGRSAVLLRLQSVCE